VELYLHSSNTLSWGAAQLEIAKFNGGTGTSIINNLCQNRFQLRYFPVAIHFILQSLIIAAFHMETLKK
jgi:hypothetical protein